MINQEFDFLLLLISTTTMHVIGIFYTQLQETFTIGICARKKKQIISFKVCTKQVGPKQKMKRYDIGSATHNPYTDTN